MNKFKSVSFGEKEYALFNFKDYRKKEKKELEKTTSEQQQNKNNSIQNNNLKQTK